MDHTDMKYLTDAIKGVTVKLQDVGILFESEQVDSIIAAIQQPLDKALERVVNAIDGQTKVMALVAVAEGRAEKSAVLAAKRRLVKIAGLEYADVIPLREGDG